MSTDFSKRVEILSELWDNYRDDESLKDFIEYNDIGLPLAYMVNTDLATISDVGMLYVNETFDIFCAALELDVESEYESLHQMLTMRTDENG